MTTETAVAIRTAWDTLSTAQRTQVREDAKTDDMALRIVNAIDNLHGAEAAEAIERGWATKGAVIVVSPFAPRQPMVWVIDESIPIPPAWRGYPVFTRAELAELAKGTPLDVESTQRLLDAKTLIGGRVVKVGRRDAE